MNKQESQRLKSLRRQYLDLQDQAQHDEEQGDEESYDETMKRIVALERKIEKIEDNRA